MMTGEGTFFLRCLADFCNGRATGPPEAGLDLDGILQQANRQGLDSVLFAQCRHFYDLGAACRANTKVFTEQAAASVNRAYLLGEILERFGAAGIPAICMKGAVFRSCWPVPELRSMADIDLVIRHEDREETDRIMLGLGYQKMVDNHAVWTYWLEGYVFEIHDHMFYEELTPDVDYIGYFDRVWDHCRKGSVFGLSSDVLLVPDEGFHFLYLMAHTAKHIINNGSGFRAFMDMYFMASACKGLPDWGWVREELAGLKLLGFTETCFRLCEQWFDVKMPFARELDDAFVREATAKAFHDGVFGLENEENEAALTAKEIRHSDKPYWLTSLQLTVRKVFPPYRNMQLVPWYKFLDGRPWLLPAAWVYRWFYVLTHKRAYGAEQIAEPFAKKDRIEQREAFLEQWGL